MLFITCALHWEAAPLIQHFGLKKDTGRTPYPIFRNDDTALVISGIGRIGCASATTYLLSRFSAGESDLVVNIGTCGAASADEKGELFLIQKITDRSTGTTCYPDILIRSEIQERALETSDTPFTGASDLLDSASLGDMEGSAFFVSSAAFVKTNQIVILKVVSDALECGVLGKDIVHKLIADQIDRISSTIDCYKSFLGTQRLEPLSSSDKEYVSQIASELCFTAEQSRQLFELARGAVLREGRPLQCILEKPSFIVHSKADTKRALNSLRATLMHEPSEHIRSPG